MRSPTAHCPWWTRFNRKLQSCRYCGCGGTRGVKVVRPIYLYSLGRGSDSINFSTDSTPLSHQFIAQHAELVQRLQILGGALPIIHAKLVHEDMSLLHIQTVMQILLHELQSLIVETIKVLGGKYEPVVEFQRPRDD